MKKLNKADMRRLAVDFVFLFLACCIGCFATVAVLLPNGLTSGGLTGIVRVIQHFIPIEFSIIYYFMSFVIMGAIGIFLGVREMRKTLLLTLMYPAVLMVFEKLNKVYDIRLLEKNDTILAAVFYGVFSGLCVGIVIWRGYCFSGTDGIGKIIRKKFAPQVAQGKIMVAIDVAVIVVAAMIFGRNIALYALITQAIISKTIDVVIFGLEFQVVQVEIITKNKMDEFLEYVMVDMGRGATTEKVIGQYTKEQHTKIRIFCSPRESMLLKRKLAQIDNKAFVSVIKTEAVWANGKGFKNIDEE